MHFSLFYPPNEEATAEKSGKIQIHNIILKIAALDFLVQKIKEWEFQNYFCRSLLYLSILYIASVKPYDTQTYILHRQPKNCALISPLFCKL